MLLWAYRLAMMCGLLHATAAVIAQPQMPPPPFDAPAPAKRIGFIIPASDYANVNDLKSVAADAQVVRELMQSMGFEVAEELPNATFRDLGEVFPQKLDQHLRRLARDDRAFVMVYFGGHGGVSGESAYLVPVDYCPAATSPIVERAMPLSEYVHLLASDARVAAAWIIVDACRTAIETIPADQRLPTCVGPDDVDIGLLKHRKEVRIGQTGKVGVFFTTSAYEEAYGPSEPKANVVVSALRAELTVPGEQSTDAFRRVKGSVFEATRQTSWPVAVEWRDGQEFVGVDDARSRAMAREKWQEVFGSKSFCFWTKYVNFLHDYYLTAQRWMKEQGITCHSDIGAEASLVTAGREFRFLDIEPLNSTAIGDFESAEEYRASTRSIVLRSEVPEELTHGVDPVARVELGDGVVELVRESGARNVRALEPGDLPERIAWLAEGERAWTELPVLAGRISAEGISKVGLVVSESGTAQIAVVPALPTEALTELGALRAATDAAIALKYQLVVAGISPERLELIVVPNTGVQRGNLLQATSEGGLFLRATR